MNKTDDMELTPEQFPPVDETSTDNIPFCDDKGTKKKKWPWILAFIVLMIGGIYGGGVYYYSSHFPHNTVMNGHALGELTVEEAEHSFTDDYAEHSIIIEEKEREEVIDASKLGMKISVGNQVKDLFETINPWLWFTKLFKEENFSIKLDVTYDEDALKSSVDGLDCFKLENIVTPVSAYIKAGDKEFEIIPEVLGNTVLKDKLIETIDNALSNCQTKINLEKDNLYLLPEYFATDKLVTDALATANLYTKGTIIHNFVYATETINYATTNKWIEISNKFDVTLNESKVGDYVDSLGKKYNTMGGAHPFTTSYGEKINVPGGDYGWRIDFKKEKKKLIKEIKSGEDVNREPVYSYTADVRSQETDLGNSYVEINLSTQEEWLYVDGECILKTSVITGSPGFETEKGVYGITYKKRGETLEGFNADGSTYASYVEYWMPFNGNQGLHDASWRNSFGGNIWKSNGSHGCVNNPTWAAATLYQYVDKGFPVVIY